MTELTPEQQAEVTALIKSAQKYTNKWVDNRTAYMMAYIRWLLGGRSSRGARLPNINAFRLNHDEARSLRLLTDSILMQWNADGRPPPD